MCLMEHSYDNFPEVPILHQTNAHTSSFYQHCYTINWTQSDIATERVTFVLPIRKHETGSQLMIIMIFVTLWDRYQDYKSN
jgi:hypothetical protein